jgi:hypothetical protein
MTIPSDARPARSRALRPASFPYCATFGLRARDASGRAVGRLARERGRPCCHCCRPAPARCRDLVAHETTNNGRPGGVAAARFSCAPVASAGGAAANGRRGAPFVRRASLGRPARTSSKWARRAAASSTRRARAPQMALAAARRARYARAARRRRPVSEPRARIAAADLARRPFVRLRLAGSLSGRPAGGLSGGRDQRTQSPVNGRVSPVERAPPPLKRGCAPQVHSLEPALCASRPRRRPSSPARSANTQRPRTEAKQPRQQGRRRLLWRRLAGNSYKTS